MRNLSTNALADITSADSSVAWLMLLTISHDTLPTPLRFVNNRVDIDSNGDTYTAFPFDIVMPPTGDKRLPIVQLSINNVDRQIVSTVRGLTTPPTVSLSVVRSEDLDTIEIGPLDFTMTDAAYNQLTVTGTLSVEPVLEMAYPAYIFNPSDFKGLF